MSTLSVFEAREYRKLVAGEKINASGGALLGEGGRLDPDETNRTIFIGIGGNGVKTINHIKSVVSKRLKPNWSSYIAFLGIDTDRTEFDKAKALTPTEYVITTWPGINDRYGDRKHYPNAALRFMPEDPSVPNRTLKLPALNSAGASQKRLVGKAKLHDHPAGHEAVDVQIVNALEALVSNGTLTGLGDQGAFEVYVIGSTCGGTCSGAFLDMPSLIRKALWNIAGSNDRLNIHAILYLPDALPSAMNANTKANLQANGYSSLKELNYYQGMEMRDGYRETWSYNSAEESELTMDSKDKFYTIPYVVGSPDGAGADAPARCREVIGEFLVSLLGKISTIGGGDVFLTEAFKSNALERETWITRPANAEDDSKERAGTHHEFPKSFAAIGFAKANAPQDLVRAYQVSKIARDAGLRPIPKEERELRANAVNQTTLLPFRAADDYMNYTVASAKIRDIMAPLDDLLDLIHEAGFNAEADLAGIDLSFDSLKRPVTRPQMDQRAELYVESKTGSEELNALERKIREKYTEFRNNVQTFVEQEGPYAFVNLYDGSMTCRDGEIPMGIGKRLQNLIDGKNMNGTAYPYMTEVTTTTTLNAAATELSSVGNTFMRRVINTLISTEQNDARSTYLEAYNNWVNAKVIAPKRKAALGSDGYLATIFLKKAQALRNDLKSFGDILDVLAGVYADHGKKMETFKDFQDANVGETTVNMAAISSASYNWLKRKADQAALDIQGRQFRTELVKHFFEGDNCAKWLDVPDRMATQDATGTVTMQFDDAVIPARELFDQIAAKVISAPVKVSVLDLFTTLKNDEGKSFDDTAKMLIDRLAIRSKPRYKGGPGSHIHQYIMYPSELGAGNANGPEVAEALKKYAEHKFPGIGVYTSDDADGIMFYQHVTGLEVYKLTDLRDWERAYDSKIDPNNIPKVKGNLLHGSSPDTTKVRENNKITYKETLSWVDYPAIVGREDPETPDPQTGVICREGQFRIKLREMMKEAIKLGVIYKEKDAAGMWHFYRVHCDRTVADWKFNISGCARNELGLLPLGQELAKTVAAQNGKSLTMGAPNCICKPITLTMAGLLSTPSGDENVAFERALRCLRANVPMYVEVVQTLEKFRVWSADIIEYNRKVVERLRPAKMAYLLRGRVLYRDDNNIWKLKNENGNEDVIADMSEDMLMFNWELQSMKDNGLVGYYLYQQINSRLPGDMLDAACRYATDEMRAMQQAKDMDAMKAGMELYKELDAERLALVAKGANPNADDRTPVSAKFKGEMFNSMNYNDSEAKAVELFYARVPLAQSLRPVHFQ